MEVKLYNQIVNDKDFFNLKKLQYKYNKKDVEEVLEILKENEYIELSIKDFLGKNLVYLKHIPQIEMNKIKSLLIPQGKEMYSMKEMEEEIHSTLLIENIQSSRKKIRDILKGYSPKDEEENRIFGMKKGIEFISNKENKITEENLYKLYQMTIGEFLKEENRLPQGNYYRDDDVFLMGSKVEHQGLESKKLDEYMKNFINFINADDKINELWKGAIIHFYFGYIHPYFDGNGRTARMLHLWYLIQKGYSSTLHLSFSQYINSSKKEYYKAFSQVEENYKISKRLDITPFITYFIENVYNKLENKIYENGIFERYKQLLGEGKITEKERELWSFVINSYGDREFSTKDLEKDYRDVAYATVRGFVLKFEEFGLLESQKYRSRVKYRVVGK